ncbi:MAG: transcriptional repressor, partial [Acidimicrobiia bacterium]
MTPQRHAIFRALTHATDHHTAEGVYAAVCTELPMISLRTVYQTLNDLSAMGELSALNLGTGSTRFDPNLEPHHHLVCDVCGGIEDLPHEFPHVLLPTYVAERFTVSATEIVFRGRCANCGPHAHQVAAAERHTQRATQPWIPSDQHRSRNQTEAASEE